MKTQGIYLQSYTTLWDGITCPGKIINSTANHIAAPLIHESDDNQLEMEFEKTFKPGQKCAKATATHCKEIQGLLICWDRWFGGVPREKSNQGPWVFECLAEREAEQELKTQKLTFDAMKDIADT